MQESVLRRSTSATVRFFRLRPPTAPARRSSKPHIGQGSRHGASMRPRCCASDALMLQALGWLGNLAAFSSAGLWRRATPVKSRTQAYGHVKEPCDCDEIPGSERVWGFARQAARSKAPGGYATRVIRAALYREEPPPHDPAGRTQQQPARRLNSAVAASCCAGVN